MTLSRSGAGSAACVNGRCAGSACQPHTMPIVTLVFPEAVIASTLLCSAVQSSLSGMAAAGDVQFAAGNSV